MTAAILSEQPSPSDKWFGIVPSHWTTPRLATLFREVDRPADPKLPVLSVSIHSGISDNELADEDRDRKVNLSEDRSKYQRVQPADLVYNMMRAWQGAFGTVTVDGLVSPAYVVAEPKASFRTKFVELLLQTASGIEEVRRFSKGIADFRMRLYWEHFRNIVVCLPPLIEQDMILAWLDGECSRIDMLVDKKRQFIELLKERRIAVITKAVTGGFEPDCILEATGNDLVHSLPPGWTIMPLKFATTKIGSGKTPAGGATAYVNSGILFLRSQNIYDDGVRLTDVVRISPGTHKDMAVSRVHPHDVLLNITGASIGRSAIVPAELEEANVNQHVCIIRARTAALSPWIHAVMCSHLGKEQIAAIQTGAGREGLNFEQVGCLLVTLPPSERVESILAELQFECSKIDRLIIKTEKSIELLREHRSALVATAVTGKLDVRGLTNKNMKAAA